MKKNIEEEIKYRVAVQGDTYLFKTALKDDWKGIYYQKKWYIDKYDIKKVQHAIDRLSKFRVDRKHVNMCKKRSDLTIDLLEKALSSFVDKQYPREDEFYQMVIATEYHPKKRNEVKSILNELRYAHNKENYQYGSFKAHQIPCLNFFNLPLIFKIKKGVVYDYAEEEEQKFNRLIEEQHYYLVELPEISITKAHENNYPPKFVIKSFFTNKKYEAPPVIIEQHESGGETRYDAKNVPILYSEEFRTVIYYWYDGVERIRNV